ncbi:MAG: SGNH/GDSL hydrolase family protein [Kiritimatiellae bacterium]|nr:SGNH/GDSL hydrolase family protein [Kiritimatiellia bacterium]
MKLPASLSSFPALCAAAAIVLSGCGHDGGGGLSNKDPGNNDVNAVVAFGDSITQGSECPCTPYPARLAGLTGKSVANCGISGSRASDNVSRTQSAIDKYHPGFMIILYGVNDIIHGGGAGTVAAAVGGMVSICKENHVVPILATYPLPIAGHRIFSGGTQAANAAIRSIASDNGLKCVDLEREFSGREEQWLMEDGLHPNDTGTQMMALAFADLF